MTHTEARKAALEAGYKDGWYLGYTDHLFFFAARSGKGNYYTAEDAWWFNIHNTKPPAPWKVTQTR